MKLKLTVLQQGRRDDVLVTTDAVATVGALAARLRRREPRTGPQAVAQPAVTLLVGPGGTAERYLVPDVPLGEAGLRSGDCVAVVAVADHFTSGTAQPPVATLHVIAGPDKGKTFPLRAGSNLVGRDRDCDVRLTDPMVSKRHVRVNVSDVVELADAGSSNGVLVDGEPVARVVLRAGDSAVLGDSTVAVSVQLSPAASSSGHSLAFNRSPRLDPVYEGIELAAPEPPQPPQGARFPLIPLLAPLLMGGVLFLVTKSATAIIFVALSPLMLVGSYVENRTAGRKAFAAGIEHFRAAVADLAVQLEQAADRERAGRRHEHPAVSEVVDAGLRLEPMLWCRRPHHDSFLTVRLGLGSRPSRNTVAMPTANRTTPDLWRELHEVADRFAVVDRVPVVADLRTGALGFAGPDEAVTPLVWAAVAQLLALHSPAEVVLAAITSTASSRRWTWLPWMPHVSSEHSPLSTAHLASTEPTVQALVSAVEDLVSSRRADRRGPDDATPLPAVVLLVEDDAPIERGRVVALAESGRSYGVHVIWVAGALERLPAVCLDYLRVDANGRAVWAGFVEEGSEQVLETEAVDAAAAEALARRLSPVVDSGAAIDDDSDLPRSISLLSLAGRTLALDHSAVVDRWGESDSLPAPGGRPRRRKDNSLRALVGQSGADPFWLDLRAHGPHALVGGTTGSGKSEFLQSWILAMAAAHSPLRVNFLLVDYKGGAAFAECVRLPHTVGLVTDLGPHLVRRALTSLDAELHYRELILNRKKAKDLLELERRGDSDVPPSLVIVVDEFAALVAEVPEFVEGVVNVAQRGRSLGLHLILATQRPAGVIKDNLRANTNLRVALRMADEDDSTDVIGTTAAAFFDPAVPGRAVAKTGPGRLTTFQSAYAGGWTSEQPPPPQILVEELRVGAGSPWEEVDEGTTAVADLGPNDIRRVVTMIQKAANEKSIADPRKPWLPVLAPVYDIASLPTTRRDSELVFGVLDDPERQDQPTVAFRPDRDGNMAVFGTGGSGKSTFLRSIAIAAGLSARGGPCTIYGLDFGARGLSMLEPLPNVGSVIGGEDHERVARLLRDLRQTIDDRAVRFAAANADTIEQYRERSGRHDEARIIVLLDGLGAFRQGYEMGERSRWFDLFLGIAADGRPVGVHVVISADRPGAVPSALSSSIQRRLVLRLANDMDYAMLDVPADAFSLTTPPGRGFVDGFEVQVAVLGREQKVAQQAAEIAKLAQSMSKAGVSRATGVRRLPEQVRLVDLPATVDGRVVIGVGDETLGPFAIEPVGVFLVAGPVQSGKTLATATIAAALRRSKPGARLVHLGSRRSPLRDLVEWSSSAGTPDDVARTAEELTEGLMADDPSLSHLIVVIEGLGEFLNGSADLALQELVRACRSAERFVVAEGETSTIAGSWPLLQAVKATRFGVALQPDQIDGDSLFRTTFPRINRVDYPPGRGLVVRSGRAHRVQVALPM